MMKGNNQQEIMEEIHYELMSGCFPIDEKMYYYVPLTLSRVPKNDLDYILYDLHPIVIKICAKRNLRCKHFYRKCLQI